MPKKVEIEFEKREIILYAAIDRVEQYNRLMTERRGKKYGVNDQLLRHVLLVDINDGTDIVDSKVRPVRRAANVFVQMLERRPFCSMNPETGLAIMAGYLKANDIPVPKEAVTELAGKVLPENLDNPQLRHIIEQFLIGKLK